MATAKATRPRKPRPDFPLFPHRNGQWAKKIRGRLHYFGTWDDPEAAHRYFVDVKEDLYAGRKPRVRDVDIVTVADCCNALLAARERAVLEGRLSQRTWDDIKVAAELVVAEFGRNRDVTDLRPDDFGELRHKQATRTTRFGKRPAPKTIEGMIKNVRQIFNFAYKNDLIEHPVKFGTEFSLPSKKEYNDAKAQVGERMFKPEEIRELIEHASPAMKAMILLAANTGIGNGDLKTMEFRHIDLKEGWLHYPRRKTGVPRRGKLWCETVAAIEEYLEGRRAPQNASKSDIVFITRHGATWGSLDSGSCPIGHQFRKLLNKQGLYRRGKSFYTLRHVFNTIGGEAKDPHALDYAMGHADGSVGNEYRERVSDARLVAISSTVHSWLFGSGRAAR